jgi:hypothetical protein
VVLVAKDLHSVHGRQLPPRIAAHVLLEHRGIFLKLQTRMARYLLAPCQYMKTNNLPIHENQQPHHKAVVMYAL